MLPDRFLLVGSSMAKCYLLVGLGLLDIGIHSGVLLGTAVVVSGFCSRLGIIVATLSLAQF